VELSTIIPALVSGVIGSAATWFSLARRLVTREDVEKMIHERAVPMEARQGRTEDLIEGLRNEMRTLSENIVRLTVTLENRSAER